MINEIESLKTLINNNRTQRDDIQKVNDQIALKINNDKLPIHEDIDHIQDKIEYINDQYDTLKNEYEKYISCINQINSEVENIDIGAEYDKILPILDKFIQSHNNRMDANADEENVKQINKIDNLSIIKITSQILTPNEDNSEIKEVLSKITEVDVELNGLADLKSKYQKHINLIQRKQNLCESMKSDIAEISAKLHRAISEIEEMK